MKMLNAACAGVVALGALAAAASPAVAKSRCGCPPVHHRPPHHARWSPARRTAYYAPPRGPASVEAAWDVGPAPIYQEAPVYYPEPIIVGGVGYWGGPRVYGRWGGGYPVYRGWVGGGRRFGGGRDFHHGR